MRRTSLTAAALLSVCGCGFETLLFPIVETPTLLSEPPAAPGPYGLRERRVELPDGADGQPLGITIFEPTDAEGPRPALLWVLGINNRAHFHQSFHENMASWGYVDVIPDTRDFSFFDSQYHERNTANANRAYRALINGELGVSIDPARTAFGGYSVGASMAAFAMASEPDARALVLWAPSPAPIWQGVSPDQLLPRIAQPSFFLLAELDDVVGDWPSQLQSKMGDSQQTVFTIPQGVHLFFQQPDMVDDRNPPTDITRMEQQRIAIEQTRAYLEAQLEVE